MERVRERDGGEMRRGGGDLPRPSFIRQRDKNLILGLLSAKLPLIIQAFNNKYWY